MIGAVVYVLCAVTSAWCAALLLRQYRRSQSRLLGWSGVAFAGLALNNLLVFADLIVVRNTDLSVLRATVALSAIVVLLFALVSDSE